MKKQNRKRLARRIRRLRAWKREALPLLTKHHAIAKAFLRLTNTPISLGESIADKALDVAVQRFGTEIIEE